MYLRLQSIVWGLLDHIKRGQPKRGSFADLLLRAKDPKTGRPLTDEQMFPEMAALFFAGIDTTGHTGTFVLCATCSCLGSRVKDLWFVDRNFLCRHRHH